MATINRLLHIKLDKFMQDINESIMLEIISTSIIFFTTIRQEHNMIACMEYMV